MNGIATTIAAAAGLFAGTNIDDLAVLAVLFLSSRASGAPKPWQIWAGQYAGFTALVLISVAAALGLAIVPVGWAGLLGVIPFVLGARGLLKAVHAHNNGEHLNAAPATSLWSVATLTICQRHVIAEPLVQMVVVRPERPPGPAGCHAAEPRRATLDLRSKHPPGDQAVASHH